MDRITIPFEYALAVSNMITGAHAHRFRGVLKHHTFALLGSDQSRRCARFMNNDAAQMAE